MPTPEDQEYITAVEMDLYNGNACTHAGATPHPHTDADGNTRTVYSCPCGMSWG